MKNINKCLKIFGILFHKKHYIKEYKKYQNLNKKQMKKDILNMKLGLLFKVIKKEKFKKKKKIKKKEMKKMTGKKEKKVKMEVI